MNTYHLIDKPVRATQWTGNLKVFRNALEMMLKTDAIALMVTMDEIFIACKEWTGRMVVGDYFACFVNEYDGESYWTATPKVWFEERYQL